MEIFSALLAICAGSSPVSGEFPAQRPATRSFDVFFDLRLNKRLSKQSRGWWFKTLYRPLWRQCNVIKLHNIITWINGDRYLYCSVVFCMRYTILEGIFRLLGALCNIRPNLGGLVQYPSKSRLSIPPISVVQSFWNIAQSTTVILPCSVQNFKTTEQLRNKLLVNEVSWVLGLICVSDGYPILHKAHVRKWFPTTISSIMLKAS